LIWSNLTFMYWNNIDLWKIVRLYILWMIFSDKKKILRTVRKRCVIENHACNIFPLPFFLLDCWFINLIRLWNSENAGHDASHETSRLWPTGCIIPYSFLMLDEFLRSLTSSIITLFLVSPEVCVYMCYIIIILEI